MRRWTWFVGSACTLAYLVWESIEIILHGFGFNRLIAMILVMSSYILLYWFSPTSWIRRIDGH